jgi:hypothetical protein
MSIEQAVHNLVSAAWQMHSDLPFPGAVILRPREMKNESENSIQAAFFEWLRLHEKKHPELALFYAIPNGTNKSYTARMVHQATGLKSGVPDTHLPIQRGLHIADEWEVFVGLWIEFKSKTGTLSENQKWWIHRLEQEKHFVAVCRSWIDAANITIEYLGLPLEPLKPEI